MSVHVRRAECSEFASSRNARDFFPTFQSSHLVLCPAGVTENLLTRSKARISWTRKTISLDGIRFSRKWKLFSALRSRSECGRKCQSSWASSPRRAKSGNETHEEDDVDDDQHVFDEVDAAAARVASLWLLDSDVLRRRRLLLFVARRAAPAAAVVVVHVVVVVVMVGRAILG
jgi:hypothetical protein